MNNIAIYSLTLKDVTGLSEDAKLLAELRLEAAELYDFNSK